jgi:hypothetical protein
VLSHFQIRYTLCPFKKTSLDRSGVVGMAVVNGIGLVMLNRMYREPIGYKVSFIYCLPYC